MRVEILGQERRRRWHDHQKLEIVNSIGMDGATITEVAQRHDISRQQIYTWRTLLRRKGLLPSATDTMFVPVDMSTAQTALHDPRPDRSGMIELRLVSGRSLSFDENVDPAVLAQLIRAVEAA